MRSRVSVVVFAVLALLLLAGQPAAGARKNPGLSGDFTLMQMVHTRQYQDVDLGIENPNPWDGMEQGGPFRYAGIPCTGNAPVNNIATNLTTYNSRLPGSRSPASTRNHPIEFTVKGSKLEGTIVLTVCKRTGGPTDPSDPIPDGDKEKIFFSWQAQYQRTSPEEVSFTGTFRITGGTGVYEDLKGNGQMSGYLFCFAAEGCASPSIGEYRDAQYTMQGRYKDPTV
ncbi:MAG: hypothetical protein M3N28_00285 [Actinomycetota bacterium]|nr:hypothetical protein [Actinomycetota bacterium]